METINLWWTNWILIAVHRYYYFQLLIESRQNIYRLKWLQRHQDMGFRLSSCITKICVFTTGRGSFSFLIGAAQHKDLASRCFKLKDYGYLVRLGRELQQCSIHWPTSLTVSWSIMLHGYAWIENLSCWHQLEFPILPHPTSDPPLSFHILCPFPLVSLPG